MFSDWEARRGGGVHEPIRIRAARGELRGELGAGRFQKAP
jgi:hypothetical protein